MFAGKFQLPGSTKTKDIKELAEETMASLGLTPVADSIVGDESRRGVSGGKSMLLDNHKNYFRNILRQCH